MNPLDKLLVGGVMALRLLDAQSTHSMIARGNHEILLPSAIANNQGAMYGYSIGAGALEGAIAIELTRHGHRRLARVIEVMDMGTSAAVVIHNDRLPAVKGGK